MNKSLKDRNTFVLVVAPLVAIVAFLFFSHFITPSGSQRNPYAYEIAAAVLGTLLTVSVTALLLRHETAQKSAAELNKEKSVKIYETQLETYQALMDKIGEILLEEKLEDKHRFQLQILFQKVVFVAGANVLEKLPEFTKVFSAAAQDGKISRAERAVILAAFGKLAIEIRADLNRQGSEDKQKLDKIISSISEDFSPKTDEESFLAKCNDNEEKNYFSQVFEYLKSQAIDYQMGTVGFSIRDKQKQSVIHMYPGGSRKSVEIVAKQMTAEQTNGVDAILKSHNINAQTFKAGEMPLASMTKIIAMLTQYSA